MYCVEDNQPLMAEIVLTNREGGGQCPSDPPGSDSPVIVCEGGDVP